MAIVSARPLHRLVRYAAALSLLALAACSSLASGTVGRETTDASLTVETWTLEAPGVSPTPLRIRAWLPPPDSGGGRYPVLYVNDGQDMEAVGLEDTLARLRAEGALWPLIVVAVDMPPDRMAAYGMSDRATGTSVVAQTKFGPVGATSHAYAEWVAKTLVPAVDARYPTLARPDARAILGWSLGGLAAFNLGWQYPEVFGRVGAFSPSLWLSSENGDGGAVQRSRIAQRRVAASAPRAGARFFFAVGTDEETDDRDGDGLHDALDDTRDLIDGWRAGDGIRMKGLRQQGYSVNLDHARQPGRQDVALFVLDGGEHHQASWARMLPVFLEWAYGR